MRHLRIAKKATLIVLIFTLLAFAFVLGSTVRYSYDQAGRLVKVQYGNGKTIEYVYDKAGNMLQRKVYGGAAFCAHVASSDIWKTRIAIVNTGDVDNPVTFEAYDAAGTLKETYVLPSLPSSASFDDEVDAIFSPGTFNQDIWVKVTSASDIKGVLVFGTRDNQTLVTIPIFATGARDLIFPYVVALNPWYTGITLINTGTRASAVTLHAYSEDGTLLQSITPDPIESNGKYVRLIDNSLFPSADPAVIRSIHIQSEYPLIGFEVFGNTQALGLAGLPAFSPTTQLFKTATASGRKNSSYRILYNEIPDDSFYYIGMTFSNLGNNPANVHLTLFDDLGAKVQETDWTPAVGMKAQVTRNIWDLFGGQAYPTATRLEASSSEKLMGFEVYLTENPTLNPFQFDGIIGVTGGARLLYFPLVQTGPDWSTICRISNLSNSNNQFTIHAFSSDGTAQGTFTRTLAANGQFSDTLETMFPATVQDIQWLYVQAAEEIIGDAFYSSSDLTRMSSYMGLAGAASK